MTSKWWIALLVLTGAGVATTVFAWPAAAKLPKPMPVRSAPPTRLPVVARTRGDDDPHFLDLTRLVPKGSYATHVWYPRSHQLLVEWIDPHRWYPVGKFDRTRAWGLRLWTDKTAGHWRAVDLPIQRANGDAGDFDIAFADVTEDGRADVLLEQYPGTNHGCGPHDAFATSHGVTTEVFAAYVCETGLFGDHGLLALSMPYYLRNDAMCCATYHEDLRLRWNGRRYETASARVH